MSVVWCGRGARSFTSHNSVVQVITIIAAADMVLYGQCHVDVEVNYVRIWLYERELGGIGEKNTHRAHKIMACGHCNR